MSVGSSRATKPSLCGSRNAGCAPPEVPGKSIDPDVPATRTFSRRGVNHHGVDHVVTAIVASAPAEIGRLQQWINNHCQRWIVVSEAESVARTVHGVVNLDRVPLAAALLEGHWLREPHIVAASLGHKSSVPIDP